MFKNNIFNKFILPSVIFTVFGSFSVIACTNTQVEVCMYEHSGQRGDKACWVKHSGQASLSVPSVGSHMNDSASSISMSPSVTASVSICKHDNYGSCSTLATNKYGYFDSLNDSMSSWKVTCN